MKFTKRSLIYFSIVIIITALLATYQLPYYIYKPGSADTLDGIVEVVDGFPSEGDMHLVTVGGLQATPIQYVWAKLRSFHEILPIDEVKQGLSDQDYRHVQLQMMESSQESSIVVAYEAADKDIEIEFNGVYVVSVVEGMPAEDKLKMADRIIGVDGKTIKEADDLIQYVDNKEAGDVINIELYRDNQKRTESITLKTFEDIEEKVGMGIQLVTDRKVQVDPKVRFSSGSIGGPSAGLMFALEIYDQLTKQDLTKGYQIVGTGAIDYNGNVQRIGGIDKKVVAADREGNDIFFAPYENGGENSNYIVAKRTAEEINSNMKIVPVDNFNDALAYLQELDPK